MIICGVMSSDRARTGRSRRRLLALTVLVYAAGAGAAMAQTVMVRNAPPGGRVELVFNADTVASGMADPAGEATLTMNMAASGAKTEIDANVFVDVCSDDLRRVVIVERGQPVAPQPAGCDRRDTGALFLVRQISTLIVDVGGTLPTVVLRQGPVRLGPPRIRRAPRGLVVFGGAGLGQTRDLVLMACGNVAECEGDQSGFAYHAGATVWITRVFGVEGSYTRPAEGEAGGTLGEFTFNSALDAHIVTVAGKVGVPLGPVRLYGQVGANYHDATFSTTQTAGDLTQTFELRTTGWGWGFGGGLEVWVAPAVGIYAEGGRAAIKGEGPVGAEGSIDDRLTFLFAGLRIRIAGR